MVPGATFEENIQRLKHTLDRFLSAGLKLKPSKCVFFKLVVNFWTTLLPKLGLVLILKKPGLYKIGTNQGPKNSRNRKSKKHKTKNKTNTKNTSLPPTLIM
jgi:hypothetical protein